MIWITFAFLGAIFQAIEMAIKKKALRVQGMNNVIAMISYTFAGILLAGLYFFQSGHFGSGSTLSLAFWYSIFWTVLLNVIGVWFLYKALDLTDLTYLMPFMTVTSLSIIIPPMIFLKEFPTPISFIGIFIVVIGAILMDFKFKKRKLTEEEKLKKANNKKGIVYFLMTALCYTFTGTVQKIAILQSNVLFSTYVVHLLLGIGFFVITIAVAVSQNRKSEKHKSVNNVLKDEWKTIKNIFSKVDPVFFVGLLAAGIAIAIQNGSINYAFSLASVANVMAIKRTMPVFAFLIGVVYFKERDNIFQRMAATFLMVVGAIIITVS